MTPNGIVHRLYIDQDKRDFLDYRWGSGNTVEIYDIEVGTRVLLVPGVSRCGAAVRVLRRRLSAR
jgi:hypothetical protein